MPRLRALLTLLASSLGCGLVRFKWTNLTVAVMLSLVIGLHWTVLQSFGWVQMFFSFAQTEPVKEALIKTFDGKHPCQVCKLVRQGKETEKRQEGTKLQTKFDYWLAPKETLLFPPPSPNILVIFTHSDGILTERPPTPPPRAA